ncbi:MAG TPA: alanine racemase [Terriglobales bacterium]|nr:alanine racemase [Terriglobales bacterium]
MPASAVTVERANLRPTWAEVSLPTLRQNFCTVRDHVAPAATVCAVVKAHAYGHGTVECARALEQEGAKWFGVTSTDEGLALRDGGIAGRILLMTGFWRSDEELVLENDLTPAVWQREHIERLEQAAERLRKDVVRVHLKVDTGMARLGSSFEELPQLLGMLGAAKHVRVEGVFSHLASSEVVDSPQVEEQMARFERAVELVKQSGLAPAYLHIANTSAIATRPKSWMNFVRPGIALYGYQLPSVLEGKSFALPVRPVLSWKTRIFSLRDVGAGQAIGYSGAYVTPAQARIAALPVGYADGLSRKLSSRGRVIVDDHYAPIVGNVSMDITLVDVSGIPGAEIGSEVIILGQGEHCSVTAADHARLTGTIPYEILCNISKRVPRQYIP